MQFLLTILRYFTFAAALAGLYGIFVVSNQIKSAESAIPQAPPQPPPARPYDQMIAANGIVESFGENVIISAPMAGMLSEVCVEIGQNVKKGDALFIIDHREIEAQRITVEAQLLRADAAVKVSESQRNSARSVFDRLDKVEDKRAIIEQEWQTAKDLLQVAESQCIASQAERNAAEAAKRSVELLISRYTVVAPRDGTVLQLNVRAGEWAGTDPKSPALLFGRIDQLQARVDVDEQNASRIRRGQKAVAHIKGDREYPIELKLEYIEPYVVPKTSLTGSSTERVDTRVLQVIFSFTPTEQRRVYVGQQIDVFIEE
ncbi:MAG: efflux RND transporter periplasmic adaptor subunit [Akkermansiaceae bacterium]